MPKKTSNSYAMGIRLDAAENYLLEKYSKLENKKKSQVLKEAFRYWVMTQKNFENKEFMLFPKPIMIRFFEDTSEQKIQNYAREHSERFLSEFKIMMLENKGQVTIENFITLLNEMFNTGLIKWFSSFEAKYDENTRKIHLYGLHTINQHFSIFLIEFLSSVLAKGFDFVLESTDKTIIENAINITFKG